MEKTKITELQKPFDSNQVKQRVSPTTSKRLDYVESWAVIDRVISCMDNDFSFEVKEYRIEANEVIVLARFSYVDEKGNTWAREQFGGSPVVRDSKTGEVVSLSDSLKASASDAFKKVCSLIGVANYLYADKEAPAAKEEKKEEPKSAGSYGGNGSNGGNAQGATNAQLRAITNLCKRYNLGTKEQSALFMEVAQVRSMSELSRATSSLVIQKLQTLEGQKAA